ncbi:MAG: RNA polymerase III-inhibiting protein maf1 [Sclerophora amabilis]|nr:MAG: RNA polymerase III-inhibiting protein maf1 [Sclerophora amabilis]
MKFIPIPMSDDVTSALNFDTNDCHVLGGCDLYTTKAAGADKKLYKAIEDSLESQYESLVELSTNVQATMSPSRASEIVSSLNLARSSPFGSLSETTSRRTFAYLIATLNASHADYDFSNFLKPSDFRREKSLKSVMNYFDSTMSSLRPRISGSSDFIYPTKWSPYASSVGADVSDGTQIWGSRKWHLIDQEMSLKDCSIYSYAPDDDPFGDDEGALWCINYFFFNKARKRVCYLYLRGLSIMSHDLPDAVLAHRRNRSSLGNADAGADKRAEYWLGDRAGERGGIEEDNYDNDEEDDGIEQIPGAEDGKDFNMVDAPKPNAAHHVRGLSEEIYESMEV